MTVTCGGAMLLVAVVVVVFVEGGDICTWLALGCFFLKKDILVRFPRMDGMAAGIAAGGC